MDGRGTVAAGRAVQPARLATSILLVPARQGRAGLLHRQRRLPADLRAACDAVRAAFRGHHRPAAHQLGGPAAPEIPARNQRPRRSGQPCLHGHELHQCRRHLSGRRQQPGVRVPVSSPTVPVPELTRHTVARQCELRALAGRARHRFAARSCAGPARGGCHPQEQLPCSAGRHARAQLRPVRHTGQHPRRAGLAAIHFQPRRGGSAAA